MLDNIFLILYIIFPFIFSFIFGIAFFIKNPIAIRRISQVFFFANTIFATLLYVFQENVDFLFINVSFACNKTNILYSAVISVIFILLSIFSKTKIKKTHRLYYPINILNFGLINLFIFCDNICANFVILFWNFLIIFLLKNTYLKNKNNSQKLILANNLLTLFISFTLISINFARYYLVNNIELTFSTFGKYLGNIEDLPIYLAFLGFCLILAKLFNLIPLSNRPSGEINKINSFILMQNFIISTLFGAILLIKIYPNFGYLFYEYQNIIGIYLIFNFIYHLLLSQGKNNILKTIYNISICWISFILFNLFSFEDKNLTLFCQSIFILIFCFLLFCFCFLAIEEKIKNLDFETIRANLTNNRFSQLVIFISLLNFMPIPFINFPFPFAQNILNIFTTQYEGNILNILGYILIIGMFIIASMICNTIYKILIEPTKKQDGSANFSFYQKIAILLTCFMIILISLLGNTF